MNIFRRGSSNPTDSAESKDSKSRQLGVVLPLVAGSLVVLMGMAALAIDIGWLYVNQVRVRKAAESAALAGVVHMPLPGGATVIAGTEPYDVAIDVSGRHGYNVGVTPAEGDTPARLNVSITTEIDTFFMKVFGIDNLTFTEDATAEHIPPLRIGSDEPYLGEDPTVGGRNRNFFVAISGEDRNKGQGDEFAARRLQSGGGNPQYVGDGEPAYWYAFEVPAASSLIGGTMQIQVFDPQVHDEDPDAITNDWANNNGDDDGWEGATRFRVFNPDDTPSEWRDNNSLVSGCDDTFRGEDGPDAHPDFDPALEDVWVTVCTVSGVQSGIYVMDVMSDHTTDPDGDTNTDFINGFSLRGATSSGSPIISGDDLQVYGLGAMSLWQFDTGSNPVFKIARLDELYAGSELILTLWDISDIGSNGTLQFVGSVSGSNALDCVVRERSQSGGSPTSWSSDDGQTNCYWTFSAQDHNNEYLDFRFDVPSDYECPAGTGSSPASPGCWIFVSYGVSGGITDRTTWSARVDGEPIRLLP